MIREIAILGAGMVLGAFTWVGMSTIADQKLLEQFQKDVADIKRVAIKPEDAVTSINTAATIVKKKLTCANSVRELEALLAEALLVKEE